VKFTLAERNGGVEEAWKPIIVVVLLGGKIECGRTIEETPVEIPGKNEGKEQNPGEEKRDMKLLQTSKVPYI